jgi:tryptophan-rich sensory protein
MSNVPLRQDSGALVDGVFVSIAAGSGMQRPERRPGWLALAGWLAAVLVVGYVGSSIIVQKIPGWYAGLAKPDFTPPPVVFSIVWTVLYVTMAVAVWRLGSAAPAGRSAKGLFIVQLVINGIWAPAFFGLQNPMLGLVVIVALFIVLVPTILLFLRIDRVAGFLLVPYLAWVGFAFVLNATIVAMN